MRLLSFFLLFSQDVLLGNSHLFDFFRHRSLGKTQNLAGI